MTPRRRLWSAWAFLVLALVPAVVMTHYFFAVRPAFAPTRLAEPLLIAAQVSFPFLGTAAVLALVRAYAMRSGSATSSPVYGWLAAFCLFLLLASLSASNHSCISWGEGFAIADVTGIGEPGPDYEVPLMLAPALTLPLLLPPMVLSLTEWSAQPDIAPPTVSDV